MARPRPFRVLVTGSRTWENQEAIAMALGKVYDQFKKAFNVEPILVHGTAAGADQMAAEYWISRGGTVEPHPADWDRWGKQAGFVRNAEMVKSGIDLTVAFIRAESKGATACAKLSEKAGIQTWVITAE